MKFKTLVLGAAMLTVSAGAIAGNNISYTNAQAGYQFWTGSGSIDGFFTNGSFRINEQVYVAAGYDFASASGYEFSTLSGRGGFILPMQGFDLYAEGGLANRTAKFRNCRGNFNNNNFRCGSFSDSDMGLFLEGGIRTMIDRQIELRGSFRHITGDYDETYLTAEGVYHITPQWSAMTNVSRLMDASEFQFQIGGRFNF